jgi:tetratricopeptide (TPR) repeat protein
MNKLYIGVLFGGLCWAISAAAVSTAVPMNATQAKAYNAEATAENTLIQQVTQAQAAHDWAGVESALTKLTAMDPGHWQYSQALGDAEYNQGKYLEAVGSYATALEGAAQDKLKAKTRQAMAAIYTNQGNSYLKLHRVPEAEAAYAKAAALSDNPGLAYFNLCATYYNQGDMPNALTACDKSLAADPKRADAYFIKGSVLVGDSTVDASGKTVAPPGAAEALQAYLKLAPDGSHAADVKQMLDFIQGAPPK